MANEATLNELRSRLDPEKRVEVGTDRDTYLRHLPRVECRDGFNMSVQASTTHYCTPRDSAGPWTEVEVGFPSERAEPLMPYVEDPNDPTGTVYGYVPIEVVAEVIDAHGGFAA